MSDRRLIDAVNAASVMPSMLSTTMLGKGEATEELGEGGKRGLAKKKNWGNPLFHEYTQSSVSCCKNAPKSVNLNVIFQKILCSKTFRSNT